MTIELTTTRPRVPQTPTLVKSPSNAQKFDATLDKLRVAIDTARSSSAQMRGDTQLAWVDAVGALQDFWTDAETHDNFCLREFVQALAKMMSDRPHSITTSKEIATFVAELATQPVLSSDVDWPEREAQCNATATLMRQLIKLREQAAGSCCHIH